MSTSAASPRSALPPAGSLSLLAVAAILAAGCANPPPHPLEDHVAPSAAADHPAPGATLVASNTKIHVLFSEEMDCETVGTTTFVLADGFDAVPGTVTCGGMDATFAPSTALVDGTTYTVTITTGAKDLAGNPLAFAATWTFTTDPYPAAPTVESAGPFDLDVAVALTTSIAAHFSAPMNCATVDYATFLVSTAGAGIAGAVSCQGQDAIFDPSTALTTGATYAVTITTGAKNVSGHPLATKTTWSFTTVP
jgi:hypothetical protein